MWGSSVDLLRRKQGAGAGMTSPVQPAIHSVSSRSQLHGLIHAILLPWRPAWEHTHLKGNAVHCKPLQLLHLLSQVGDRLIKVLQAFAKVLSCKSTDLRCVPGLAWPAWGSIAGCHTCPALHGPRACDEVGMHGAQQRTTGMGAVVDSPFQRGHAVRYALRKGDQLP